MANVIINDTNLTNIANAIREKNGETTTYKPSEMATAILAIEGGGSGGGGYEPTDEELTYTTGTPFTNGDNAWVLKNYGDRVNIGGTSSNSTKCFSNYPYEVFDVNPVCSGAAYLPLKNMFDTSSNLKEITGTFHISSNHTNGYLLVNNIDYMFANCDNLRFINDDFIDSSTTFWVNSSGTNYCRINSVFAYCRSLREVPKFFNEIMRTYEGTQPNLCTNVSYNYTMMFYECSALNKIEGLFVALNKANGGSLTSNMFSNTFTNCYNLSKLTFATNEDGTPLTANWTNQTIDLYRTGASIGFLKSGQSETQITGYNSGFTAEDEIEGNTKNNFAPDAQYYIGDGVNKYWTADGGCAKYGHTEAVETINSLPDTSAAGGGNTISFYSRQGKFTDYLKGRTNDITFDSSIGTLTEAEIAVATAKGWTVSLNT